MATHFAGTAHASSHDATTHFAYLAGQLLGTLNLVIQPGATEGEVEVVPPVLTDLQPGGTLNCAPFYTDLTLTLSDGTDSAVGTVQLLPEIPSQYGVLGAGPYDYAPSGAAQNDQIYMYSNLAGTFTPASGGFTPVGGQGVGSLVVMVYDFSAEEWIMETFVVDSGSPPPAEGEGVIRPVIQPVIRIVMIPTVE